MDSFRNGLNSRKNFSIIDGGFNSFFKGAAFLLVAAPDIALPEEILF